MRPHARYLGDGASEFAVWAPVLALAGGYASFPAAMLEVME